MNHSAATRQALLGEAAAFLAAALGKLDMAACDVAAVHASHALELVEELLADAGSDPRSATDRAGF